jgi:hypothetical protein
LSKTTVAKSPGKAETPSPLKGKVVAKPLIVANGGGTQENGVSGDHKEETAAAVGLANGNHEKSEAAGANVSGEEQVKSGGMDNGASEVVVEDLLGISSGNGGSDQVKDVKEEELVALADVS